jgi:hypothetical protein
MVSTHIVSALTIHLHDMTRKTVKQAFLWLAHRPTNRRGGRRVIAQTALGAWGAAESLHFAAMPAWLFPLAKHTGNQL